jgi:tripartite-type tricarboxylate transporter receptor subunit TctC
MKRAKGNAQKAAGTGGLILLCWALWAASASAQSYPARPIRMLIPQPAGGTMDTIARMVSHEITPVLGQNIVIDNRSGANGIIAGETLARAAPDGYTLLYTSASLANNQLVHKKLPFDALKDFAPVTQVTTLPGYLILVNPQLPAKTLKDLIELSRKSRVHFGSSGYGNSQHLLGELINSKAGARMVHVPYKGFALIINGLMGNEVQVAFGAPTTVVPHIKAGRLRAIAYTGDTRWSGMPELPTAAESGMPGFSYEASWHGLFAPAATPRAIVSRLQTEIRKAVLDPRMRAKLESGGHVPIGSTPAEFARFLRSYFKDTAEQLRIANVQPQ